mgnify:CR=1 FL=1
MYQLKGRVGRSSTQAYAYFMFPENVPLTEEAAARLTAINEHQDLGSGMRIAMRDLEIRGAGSLLGAEQSGNMSAVGFDLFAQMLNQAVNETREGVGASGELPPALSDITVNIPGHAYLPEEYIPDADARVLWYRKLASAATVEEVAALRAGGADDSFLEGLGLEYRYILWYLTGKIPTLDALKDELGRAIKRFAKRQMVWFQKDRDVLWLDMEGDFLTQAVRAVEDFLA